MKSKTDDFIDRSFRNVADDDYIAARICWKRELAHQFYWMASQAVEKYLKAILLYSRKDVRDLDHNITKALERVRLIPSIKLSLAPDDCRFIEHLNEQGPNRYFEWNLRVKGDELLQLDKCVWGLRTRCVALDSYAKVGDRLIWTSKEHFEKIEKHTHSDNPGNIWIPFGRLEKVLSKKSETRRDLVWKNFYFGRNIKKSINWKSQTHFSSPTHVCHPGVFQELNRLVKFSSKIKNHFLPKASKMS